MNESVQVHIPPIERVPVAPLPPLSERERIHVAAMTAIAEIQLGADVEITEDDANLARQIVRDGRRATKTELAKPGVVLKLEALLDEYDYEVVDDAKRLRAYVTNRLIEESDNPDPKIRLRALEMLGKVSEVGLFTERREVIVTNRSEKDLQAELQEHLSVLMDAKDITDVSETGPEDGDGNPLPVYAPTAHDISNAISDIVDDL